MALENKKLNEQLNSLRIERVAAAPDSARPRVPRKTLLAISVVIVLAVFGYQYFFSAAKVVTAAPVQVETGAPSSANAVLSVSGYVVAHHKIAVGAKVSGRVSWIGVEKGDKVTSGQILVRLEDDEFRARVNQARANVAAAQARLDQLLAGSRPQEKVQARAGVAREEAALRNAEADYQRIEQLYREKVVSKAELDRALAARDSARAALDWSRQTSAIADIGPRSEEIQAARAELQQMRAALDYAQAQLDSTLIRAPVSGTILERIVERGEMVTPSAMGESGARTSVVSLADLTDLQIEVDISQTDFSRLKMGQRAEITPEAFSSLRYSGHIAEIAPEANRAKATVQVKVKVESPDEQLRPEMNARVNFLGQETGEKPRADARRVLVPKTAVIEKDNSSFVFVVKGGKVEQRVIRTTPAAGEFHAVLEGLVGGEMVVTAGADKLSDGDRVRVGTK